MRCNKCEALFGSHYSICPVCGSEDFEREKFKVIEKEVEEVEKISPFVEMGETDDMDGML